MSVDELQALIVELKAEGLKGRPLIRALADRTNSTFTELRELLRQIPDYKRYNGTLNGIILAEKKKGTAQNNNPPTDYVDNDYMEHLTPVWNQLQELNQQEKEASQHLKAIQQKKRNMIATLKQFLEYAEGGEEP